MPIYQLADKEAKMIPTNSLIFCAPNGRASCVVTLHKMSVINVGECPPEAEVKIRAFVGGKTLVQAYANNILVEQLSF